MTAPPLHCLYRLYDGDGRLIYIGATSQPVLRFDFHRRHSWWWKVADRVELEWPESRDAAFAAEAVAIQEERPAFNIHYSDGPDLTEADREVARRWLAQANATVPVKALHRARVAAGVAELVTSACRAA